MSFSFLPFPAVDFILLVSINMPPASGPAAFVRISDVHLTYQARAQRRVFY